MVNSLRKVDFSHPTGHYTWKKSPPLEKILGAPLAATIDAVTGVAEGTARETVTRVTPGFDYPSGDNFDHGACYYAAFGRCGADPDRPLADTGH